MAAVSNWIDRVRANVPGVADELTMASSAPPRPAQAELTTKASTCSRATFRPDNEAATSSSRSARQLRPILLRRRLASSTNVISAHAQPSQASHRVGGNVEPRTPGVLPAPPSPPPPPQTPPPPPPTPHSP